MKKAALAALLAALAFGSAWCTPSVNIGGPDATWHRVELGSWEAGTKD